MRYAGAAGIMLCALMIGLELRRRANGRVRQLDGMCALCRVISSGIRYERRPLDSIMKRLPEGMPAFAAACAKRMETGEEFHTAWRKACESSAALRLLEPGERETIIALGDELGRSDVQGELELLSTRGEMFAEARDEAHRMLPERTKLCLSCSLLAGMTAAVLLL